uniref:Gelsolin-like domain-containing protein n=1 Tax=Heterorhabditis bacteriophora TaxID=37862 RepID=A0A1I7WH52_HETBA
MSKVLDGIAQTSPITPFSDISVVSGRTMSQKSIRKPKEVVRTKNKYPLAIVIGESQRDIGIWELASNQSKHVVWYTMESANTVFSSLQDTNNKFTTAQRQDILDFDGLSTALLIEY